MSVGGRIGPYRIERELGRGGMGVVYAAHDEKLGRQVALKLLLAGAYGDSEAWERFLREGQAVARLNHPGIVRIHELSVHEGKPCLAMDLIEGGSLEQRLKTQGPLPPREAALIARDLASAVAHAHRKGVLHRDLKPANVLLRPDGATFVTDFGLAKDLSDTKERLTRSGDLVGTPSYMAPEQINAVKDIDERADVYGLGGTLYAMLTGRPPFAGGSTLHTLDQVLKADPVKPSAENPEVPAALEAVCLKALAKQPVGRYPSARALSQDLERFLAGESVEALGPGRRLLLGAALGTLAGVAALVLVALFPGKRADPKPGRDPAPVAPVATASEPAASESRRELQAIEALGDPFQVLLAREAWLDAHPVHPQHRQVRAALGRQLAEPLRRIVLGPDLERMAFVGSDRLLICEEAPRGQTAGGLRLWDLAGGEQLWEKRFPVNLQSLSVHPGGGRALVGGGHMVFLVDLRDGSLLKQREGLPFRSIEAVDVAWERERALVGGELRKPPQPLLVLDTKTLQTTNTLGPFPEEIRAVAWSPTRRRVAVAIGGGQGCSNAVHVVEVTGAPKIVDSLPGNPVYSQCLAYWPGHRDTLVLGWGSGMLELWAPPEMPRKLGENAALGLAHQGKIHSMAFSQDGQMLYTVSRSLKQPLKAWRVPSGAHDPDAVPKLPPADARWVALSPEERRVAVRYGNTIDVWALPRRARARHVLAEPSLSAVACANGRLVTGNINGRLRSWDLVSGRQVSALIIKSPTHSLAVSPDGRRAIVGSNGRLLSVNLERGKVDGSVPVGWGPLRSLAVNWSTGRVAVTGQPMVGRTNRVELLDLSLNSLGTVPVEKESWVFDLAWSPRGDQLALTTTNSRDNKVLVVDPQGSELYSLDVPSEYATRLAWSTDGEHLAFGTAMGDVFLWAVAARELRKLSTPTRDGNLGVLRPAFGGPISGLAFVGERLLACANDPPQGSTGLETRNLRVWRVPAGEEISEGVPRLEGADLQGMALSADRLVVWAHSRIQVWDLTR